MTAIDERALGAAIIEGSNMAGERLVTQIVTAYLKALGDEGWVLVPKEPTTKMLAAGQTAWLADPCRKSSTLYRAMLAAAGGTDAS